MQDITSKPSSKHARQQANECASATKHMTFHIPRHATIRLRFNPFACVFLKCHPYLRNFKDRLRITLRIIAKTNEILRIMRIVIYGFRNYKPITTILTILKISLVFTMIFKMILKNLYVRIEMSRTG